jgi:hypothetical protein
MRTYAPLIDFSQSARFFSLRQLAFRPLFPICDFVRMNICLYTVQPSVFERTKLRRFNKRKALYVLRNIEARLRNHCYSEKVMCITYCKRVSSLSSPTCNAHAPYCHLWPAWLSDIFPNCLTNGMIFAKKVVEHKIMWVSNFPTNLSQIFLILRRTEQNMIKNVYWSWHKVQVTIFRF